MDPDDERTIVQFWAAKINQQLPAAMPSLHRWKDQDRIHYVDTHPGAKDPLEATMEKLIRAARALEAMDRVGPVLIDRTDRHERLLGQVRDIAERMWEWHAVIRMLRTHNSSDLIKFVMDTSWVLMIKSLFQWGSMHGIMDMETYGDPPLPVPLYANVWAEFPFLELLQHRGRGILFTNPTGMLKSLSLGQWMTAYYEFKRVYLRTGFSPSAAAYLWALVYQYGSFVYNRHESNQARERCYDMADYRVQGIDLPCPLLGGPLNDKLIRAHEPDLFYTLRHLRAASAFYEAGAASWRPMSLAERRGVVHTLAAFITAMLADRRMYTTFASEVRTHLLRRALQPGDSAIHHQTRGLKPSRTDYAEASEILSSQRHDFYTIVHGKEGFSKDTIETHMKLWLAEQEKLMAHAPDDNNGAMDADDDDDTPQARRARMWDLVSVERSMREFVMVLIVQSAFDIYARYACRVRNQEEFDLYRHGFMDDASVPPPLDTPPESPAVAWHTYAENMGRKPPFFVVLSHMYAVVVSAEETRVSPRFEEAFTWWLREAVRGGQLSKETIHATLWPLLLRDDQLVRAGAPPEPAHGPRLFL